MAGPSPSADRPVRVFISYAHGSVAHISAVHELSLLLIRLGFDVRIDSRESDRRQSWPQWISNEMRLADYVLVIASAEYRRRAEGLAPPEESRGVAYEAFQIREQLYANPAAALRKYLPVLLPGAGIEDIPEFLGPTSTSRYEITDFTEPGAARLLRVLAAPAGGRPAELPPATRPGLPLAAPPGIPSVGRPEIPWRDPRRDGHPPGERPRRPGADPDADRHLVLHRPDRPDHAGGPDQFPPPGHFPSPDLPPIRAVATRLPGPGAGARIITELSTLVNLLLAVPDLSGPPRWQQMIGLLPPYLAGAIPRQDTSRTEAIALLRTCDHYPDGWTALVAALRLIAPGSPAVRLFVDELARLGLDVE